MKFLSIDNTLINFDHIINMEYGISLQDDEWYGFYINVYHHGSDKPIYYQVGYSTDKEEWEKYVYRFSNEYDDISQLFTYKLNELLNDSNINIININTLEGYIFNQIMEEDYQDIYLIKKAKIRNENKKRIENVLPEILPNLLLAAALNKHEHAKLIVEHLNEKDIFDKEHLQIFQAIKKILNSDFPIVDALSLNRQLSNEKEDWLPSLLGLQKEGNNFDFNEDEIQQLLEKIKNWENKTCH